MSSFGSLTGGGGLSTQNTSAARTGNVAGTAGTGVKNINIGGNPNVTSGSLTLPLLIGVGLLGYWAWTRAK